MHVLEESGVDTGIDLEALIERRTSPAASPADPSRATSPRRVAGSQRWPRADDDRTDRAPRRRRRPGLRGGAGRDRRGPLPAGPAAGGAAHRRRARPVSHAGARGAADARGRGAGGERAQPGRHGAAAVVHRGRGPLRPAHPARVLRGRAGHRASDRGELGALVEAADAFGAVRRRGVDGVEGDRLLHEANRRSTTGSSAARHRRLTTMLARTVDIPLVFQAFRSFGAPRSSAPTPSTTSSSRRCAGATPRGPPAHGRAHRPGPRCGPRRYRHHHLTDEQRSTPSTGRCATRCSTPSSRGPRASPLLRAGHDAVVQRDRQGGRAARTTSRAQSRAGQSTPPHLRRPRHQHLRRRLRRAVHVHRRPARRAAVALSACLVAEVHDGLIVQLAEYLDSGKFGRADAEEGGADVVTEDEIRELCNVLRRVPGPARRHPRPGAGRRLHHLAQRLRPGDHQAGEPPALHDSYTGQRRRTYNDRTSTRSTTASSSSTSSTA